MGAIVELNAKWIIPSRTLEGETAPVYRKRFASGPVKKAILRVTALGVYRAELNGKRVSEFILAPGVQNNVSSRMPFPFRTCGCIFVIVFVTTIVHFVSHQTDFSRPAGAA